MARKPNATAVADAPLVEHRQWKGTAAIEPLLVPLHDLHRDPANARRHPQRNLDTIRASLTRFGQQRPILIDGDGVIRAGNGTHEAAESLGWTHIAAVRTDLRGSEATAYAITDNRSAEQAEWEDATLAETLRALQSEDFPLDAVGFSDDEVDELIKSLGDGLLGGQGGEPAEDPGAQVDRAEELQAKWGTALGQLWVIPSKATPGGEHRLLCGDSTKAEDVARVIAGEEIDSIVTDPPYGMRFQSGHRSRKHDEIAGDEDDQLLGFAIGLQARHSKYIWCRWDDIPKSPRPRSVITWVKNNWSMGDLEHEHARQTEVCLFYPGLGHSWPNGRPADVVSHPRTGNDLHPTEKPSSLLAEVLGWTVGVVYDPFVGSGTTIVAAEQIGRLCRGLELAPKYVAVALERLSGCGLSPRLAESTSPPH